MIKTKKDGPKPLTTTNPDATTGQITTTNAITTGEFSTFYYFILGSSPLGVADLLARISTWQNAKCPNVRQLPMTTLTNQMRLHIADCQVAMSAMWKIAPTARPPLSGPKVAK